MFVVGPCGDTCICVMVVLVKGGWGQSSCDIHVGDLCVESWMDGEVKTSLVLYFVYLVERDEGTGL